MLQGSCLQDCALMLIQTAVYISYTYMCDKKQPTNEVDSNKIHDLLPAHCKRVAAVGKAESKPQESNQPKNYI